MTCNTIVQPSHKLCLLMLPDSFDRRSVSPQSGSREPVVLRLHQEEPPKREHGGAHRQPVRSSLVKERGEDNNASPPPPPYRWRHQF